MKNKPASLPASALTEIGHVGSISLKLNRILVPVDFSDSSKNVLQYAVLFAKQFGASIALLHVLALPSATDDLYEDETAHKLKAWADEFVPHTIPVQTQTRRGAEAIEIVNEAKRLKAGLMIVSTHGRTGRAHALAGSLAENLVQLAPCPVLVVREHEHDFINTAAEIPTVTDNVASAI